MHVSDMNMIANSQSMNTGVESLCEGHQPLCKQTVHPVQLVDHVIQSLPAKIMYFQIAVSQILPISFSV